MPRCSRQNNGLQRHPCANPCECYTVRRNEDGRWNYGYPSADLKQGDLNVTTKVSECGRVRQKNLSEVYNMKRLDWPLLALKMEEGHEPRNVSHL